MAFKAEWIFVVLALLALARSGSALRCWDCASNMNNMCGDPMNTTEHQATFHTKICESGPYESSKPICRKVVKKEYGERIVLRMCSTPNVDEVDIVDGACSSMGSMGRSVIESCHICSTDLCNSASGATATQLLYIGALALVGYRLFHSKYNL